jgi:hypothetical protein
MEALERLELACREASAAIGLDQQLFQIVIGKDGNHIAQVVFTIDLETLSKGSEQVEIDRAFEEMVRDQKLSERDQQEADAEANLRRMSQRFLDDGS